MTEAIGLEEKENIEKILKNLVDYNINQQIERVDTKNEIQYYFTIYKTEALIVKVILKVDKSKLTEAQKYQKLVLNKYTLEKKITFIDQILSPGVLLFDLSFQLEVNNTHVLETVNLSTEINKKKENKQKVRKSMNELKYLFKVNINKTKVKQLLTEIGFIDEKDIN